jgi:hypothetical protein
VDTPDLNERAAEARRVAGRFRDAQTAMRAPRAKNR